MQAKLEDRRRKIEGLPPVLSSAEDDTLDAAPQQEGNSDPAAGEQEPGTLAQPVAGAGSASFVFIACIPEHVTPSDFCLFQGLLSAVEGFRTCLCPRCLHAMPLRRHRPRAAIYVGGVSCDRCKRELLGQASLHDEL